MRAGSASARAPKLGHGGTLDPMASGVLPVCVGEATKVIPFLLGADKEYLAAVRFGVETDTLDATGQVLSEKPVGNLDAVRVEAALAGFRGAIEQVPQCSRRSNTTASRFIATHAPDRQSPGRPAREGARTRAGGLRAA